MTDETRTCRNCGETLPLEDFKPKGKGCQRFWRCRRCYYGRKRLARWNSESGRIKVLARNQVSAALKTGRLVRQPCEVCGAAMVHGHHDDYSKPLEVRWLCPEHHKQHHESLNRKSA